MVAPTIIDSSGTNQTTPNPLTPQFAYRVALAVKSRRSISGRPPYRIGSSHNLERRLPHAPRLFLRDRARPIRSPPSAFECMRSFYYSQPERSAATTSYLGELKKRTYSRCYRIQCLCEPSRQGLIRVICRDVMSCGFSHRCPLHRWHGCKL